MVTDILVADSALSEAELLTLAASAEQGSEHPLGEAIVGAAKERQLPLAEGSDFSAIPGHGIRVTVNERVLLLGNIKLMKEEAIELSTFNKRIVWQKKGKPQCLWQKMVRLRVSLR